MSIAFAGLAMGFLGSSHCVGMCGGIASALSAQQTGGARQDLQRSLAYNLGRVSSYAAAGAVAGSFGAALVHAAGSEGMLVLRSVAALLIIGVGLSVMGWPGLVTRLEVVGGAFWKRVAPLARRARMSESPFAPFLLGTLWGWLPCGLVYSALALAVTGGSAATGALVMAAFGLGTLPAVVGVGLAAQRGVTLLRGANARRAAGAMVVGFGVWTFVAAGSNYWSTPPGAPACHTEPSPDVR